MSDRVRGSVVVLAAGILVILGLNLVWPVPTANGEEVIWMWVAGLMAFPVAAAIILAHRPHNRVGWALGVSAVSAGLIFVTTWYAVELPDAPLSRYVEAFERIPSVGQFAGIVGLLYVFPTGQPAQRWSAAAFKTFLVATASLTVLWLFSPSPLLPTGRPNPLGVLPGWLGSVEDLALAFLALSALAAIGSLLGRWRGASAVERKQLEWFIAGAAFFILTIVGANVLPGDSGDDEIVAGSIVVAAFWSLPAAIVIAVMRYDLFEIDRILKRTLSYGLLTLFLGALYVGLVVGLQTLLRPVTGGEDFAIVATTLVVAALFFPARRRLQAAVDRRFNRRSYEAARTVAAFSGRLREQIDLDTLRAEVAGVLASAMEPSAVSVWIRPRLDTGW
jgi:hypothetical protein